jgi:hypothetical protein
MGYSSLVDCKVLSPNHSGYRIHKIDRITPHCVVGQLSAENIGGCFTSASRQASCNYGIGFDGRVCLVVDEDYRSWCTSSSANDQRAITVEVASDKTEPYAFKDAAYNKLIDLTVDICKRHNKTKLVWISDKTKALAYEPKSNELQVTVHRWYANKSCPGNWMMGKMDDYVAKVNSKLASEVKPATPKSCVNMTEKEIWDYLVKAGLTKAGVAGLMGNLYAECGLKACNLQNNGNNKLGLTDEQFTAKVDSGEYSKETFIRDGYGYGLAQWTYWSRKQAFYEYVVSKGASIGCCKTQLEYLVKEISGYKAVINVLKTTASVREASDIVLLQYERPADQSEAVQVKRANFGQVYYDKYATVKQPEVKPEQPVEKKYYRVRLSWDNAKSQLGAYEILDNAKAACKEGYSVYDWNGQVVYSNKPVEVPKPAPTEIYKTGMYKVVCDDLNIRKGPSTDYDIVGVIKDHGTYTIVEVQNGHWGKLKSGAGWISIHKNYCTRKGDIVSTPQVTKKSNEEIAKEVIKGLWGNGQARKDKLKAAGYDYATIQSIVNKLLR